MKIKLIVILVLVYCTSNSQTPYWQWAKSAGRYTSHDYCYSISTDAQGNSYVTGEFQDTIDFGSSTLGNPGTYNQLMYLAKYDAAGNVVWGKIPGGNNGSKGNCVFTGNEGLYVTGAYRGNITLGTSSFTANGFENYFLAKYDSSGNIIWARDAICHAQHAGNSVCSGASGNVYVTGYYQDSSITFGNIVLPNTGTAIIGTDIFIVKYNQLGNALWAHGIGGTHMNNSYSICVDNNDNAYITGQFRNSITFGNTTLTGTNGAATVFTAKYDAAGNLMWAKSSGAFPSSGYGKDISTDVHGNCYVTGYFNSPIIIFDNDTLWNAGINDIFVVKYDNTGAVVWARNFGGSDFDEGRSITADSSGNCYLTGFFKNFIQFGNTNLSGLFQEVFVAKLDQQGNPLWALHSTGSRNEVANGISIDANGNVYIGGVFSSDNSTFGNNLLLNSDPFLGSYDLFVAKIDFTNTAITEQNIADHSYHLFPNPVSNKTILKFDNPTNDPFNLAIYDSQGRLIRNVKNIRSSQTEIEKGELKSGLYFFQLITDKETNVSGKFIVE